MDWKALYLHCGQGGWLSIISNFSLLLATTSDSHKELTHLILKTGPYFLEKDINFRPNILVEIHSLECKYQSSHKMQLLLSTDRQITSGQIWVNTICNWTQHNDNSCGLWQVAITIDQLEWKLWVVDPRPPIDQERVNLLVLISRFHLLWLLLILRNSALQHPKAE